MDTNELFAAMSGKSNPREWTMDPHPHFFAETYSKYNQAIVNAMKKYENTCAEAKVRMYMEIGKILGIEP